MGGTAPLEAGSSGSGAVRSGPPARRREWMRKPVTWIIVGLVVASAVLLTFAATRALVWSVGQVEDHARSPSLALDASGSPHLAYIGGSGGGLEYASRTGSSWSIETVDAGTYSGDFAADTLALDAAGQPHIAYHDSSKALVKYAHRTQTGWSVEAVGHSGYIYSSLAVDSAGRPSLAYQHGCSETDNKSCSSLEYAHWTGSAWEYEIVDPPTQDMTGLGPSMAFDSQDRPHIAYIDFAGYNSTLRHAYRTGTGWQIEIVTTANFGGENVALALDSFDRPHIAYTQLETPYVSAYPLYYASKSGTSWTIETVDHSLGILDYDSHLDLTFGASGHAAISYESHGLKYASQTGSGWSIEAVDGWASWTGSSSVAVDASGARSVAYAVGACGWMSGCAERTVMYAHAGSPESANVLTWALVIAGLVTGTAAAVVFVWDRRRRAQRSK